MTWHDILDYPEKVHCEGESSDSVVILQLETKLNPTAWALGIQEEPEADMPVWKVWEMFLVINGMNA
ncbi:hypothetical protein WISP_74294 [Willisornis vidua]|uniref:Uncharacterized protein n=1 Tax=Willisornis vidua TaxID=1566151 RepID=A0ABQ9DBT4_9PASS|nr:hypothetical protein WISP_74294 [Willisornis vidua]